MDKGRFNAAGFDATQSIINANDALTIYFLGKRPSMDHREAVRLHVDVVRVLNDSSCRDIVKNALEMRSEFGYLGTATNEKEARKLVFSAIKFLSWVKSKIQK